MKLEIGKTYHEYGDNYWVCIDFLSENDEFQDYGCTANHNHLSKNDFPFVCILNNSNGFYIDRFKSHGDEFINANGTTRTLTDVTGKVVIAKKIKKILENTMKKNGKRFVCFTHGAVKQRIVACINSSNLVCSYGGEKLPASWSGWRISDFEELDITFEQYLKINGFKVKSKEEEIAELEAKVIEKLGCQKEHLTPVLKAFVELLKQIKASKSTFKEISEIVMGRILKNENYIGEEQAEVKAIYNILKQIKEKI